MGAFNQCFVILELFFIQLLSAGSYTVVLKQVKPLHPSFKVYKYELQHPKIFPEGNTQYIYHRPFLGQRIYPVAAKPGRDLNYKARVPVKKEKGSNIKISSSEKLALRNPRLLGLSQSLVPPVSNQLDEYSEAREDKNDARPFPASFPHTGKSFSSFGQEKGRIYNNPGDWATPAPQANPENTTAAEFTPSQLYLQIRHKNTVIHVPQSEALKDAETLEELINAPRLKELSRTTHVLETYSEEGYEDAGYDHAGHIRQAQHGEIYNSKDEGRFNIKEPPIILDYDSDLEESKEVPSKQANVKKNVSTEENSDNRLEPRITRSRSEMSKTSIEYAKIPKSYKGEHKYSSKVKSSAKIIGEDKNNFNATNLKEFPSIEATFPNYFGEMPPTPASILANDSDMPYKSLGKKSSKYRKSDLNSTKIYPVSQITTANSPYQINDYTNFNPYISLIDSQASPSAKSLKYSRIYSKKTKQLRLEPYKNYNIYSPPSPSPISLELLPQDVLPPPRLNDEMEEVELANQRIVLPTIGYINSLTTAHFGKGNSKPIQDESKSQLTGSLNLTQALNYLRTKKKQQNLETTKSPTEFDIRTFEPMKLKSFRPDPRSSVNKIKRDIHLMETQKKKTGEEAEEYEGSNESDLPYNKKNEEIAEDERKRIEDENREKEKYEAQLKQEISNQEKKIIKETFENIGVEKDVSEVFPESPFSDSELVFPSFPVEKTLTPVNFQKYPFYMSKRLPENSPLRYATNPKQFPKKSGYKMEFYESRESLIQCPDLHPDLDDLSNSNSTEHSDEQVEKNPRIGRLGDKITCLRMKYFDPEPFDNPIFKEKEIDYVGKRTKGQKKVGTQIMPKTVKLNKKDQKFLQTSHQKSYAIEQKDQNPSKVFKASTNNSQFQSTLKPLKSFSFNQLTTSLKPNTTEKDRVVPVTEVLNDFPPYSSKTMQSRPDPNLIIGWKTVYPSQDWNHDPRKSLETKNQIIKLHNCLTHISKMTDIYGAKNLTFNCKDNILMQEIINNVPRLRIIPKERNKGKEVIKNKWNQKIPIQQFSDQTDWIPIVGYRLPKHSAKSLKPLSRRTDEVSQLKNETSQNNSSAHYVIDELKEDENVRKGEVVEDMNHYLKLMEDLIDETTETITFKVESEMGNSTRKKREAQNNLDKPNMQNNFAKRLEFTFDKSRQIQTSRKSETEKSLDDANPETSKPFEAKRPLKRLSGIDFLIRYHKNKRKPTTQKVEDFWKVAQVTNRNTQKVQKKSLEKSSQATSKNREDKSDKTTTLQSVAETTVKKPETKEVTEVRKYQKNSSIEKQDKRKSKQANGTTKISPLNLIPEKVTKKPESKPSEFWKASTQSAILEKATVKPLNFTKIVTKVSRETSESTEKARVIYRQGISHSGQNSSTESPAIPSAASTKPEMLQFKTLNRSLTSSNNDSEHPNPLTENSEGPILYYIINLKTGRGKWITNFNVPSRGNSGKYRKFQNLKESSGTKRKKSLRRKKPQY